MLPYLPSFLRSRFIKKGIPHEDSNVQNELVETIIDGPLLPKEPFVLRSVYTRIRIKEIRSYPSGKTDIIIQSEEDPSITFILSEKAFNLMYQVFQPLSKPNVTVQSQVKE